MPLYALTEENEIAAAYKRFADRVREGATPHESHLGGQNTDTYPVYWHSALEMWGLHTDNEEDHYWFGFGTDDPAPKNALTSSVVQFGFVREGSLRNRTGVFARDGQGVIHLAHTGKIGGGRVGTGQTAFLDLYNGQFTNIHWRKPKNAKVEYILLGALDAPDFMQRISDFVHSVEDFKESVVASKKKK